MRIMQDVALPRNILGAATNVAWIRERYESVTASLRKWNHGTVHPRNVAEPSRQSGILE